MKNAIRITSGKLRGREILTPGEGTHPMGDREKLALFNMLTGRIEGARVLDAFAGSGALGIEALSRGAKEVVFVEKSPRAVRVIKDNLAKLDLIEHTEIIACDVLNYTPSQPFDVILADPPYDNFNLSELQELYKMMTDDGILVLSHPEFERLKIPLLNGLTPDKTRKYARACLTFYSKNA